MSVSIATCRQQHSIGARGSRRARCSTPSSIDTTLAGRRSVARLAVIGLARFRERARLSSDKLACGSRYETGGRSRTADRWTTSSCAITIEMIAWRRARNSGADRVG